MRPKQRFVGPKVVSLVLLTAVQLSAADVPKTITGVEVASGDKMMSKRAYLAAPKAEVFEFMSDFASMPDWMDAVKRVDVDNQHSENGLEQVGVGTQRICKMTGATCREVVVHFDAPNSLVYRMVESNGIGMPFSEGTGFIVLQDAQGGGTILNYHVVYDTKKLHPAGLVAGKMMEKQLGEGLENVAAKFGGRMLK